VSIGYNQQYLKIAHLFKFEFLENKIKNEIKRKWNEIIIFLLYRLMPDEKKLDVCGIRDPCSCITVFEITHAIGLCLKNEKQR